MSEKWVDKTLQRMEDSKTKAIQELAERIKPHRDKIVLRSAVLDPKGVLRVNSLPYSPPTH
jgi:hypothetical protein